MSLYQAIYMNSTTAPTSAAEYREISVITARLLLRQALRKEQEQQGGEAPELARKRALKELTGASLDLPVQTASHEDHGATSAATRPGAGLREIVTIHNARPDE